MSRAVKRHTVLSLDGGHTVHPAQAGGAEHGDGDGLLQPLPRGLHQAPVLAVVRETDDLVVNNPTVDRWAAALSLLKTKISKFYFENIISFGYYNYY